MWPRDLPAARAQPAVQEFRKILAAALILRATLTGAQVLGLDLGDIRWRAIHVVGGIALERGGALLGVLAQLSHSLLAVFEDLLLSIRGASCIRVTRTYPYARIDRKSRVNGI